MVELSSEIFVESAKRHAEERYLFDDQTEELGNIILCAPATIIDKKALRLKRKEIEGSSPRTILIGILESKDDISAAFKWAANVRDELLNPESADLYLFIGFKTGSLSIEQALKYESNDLFCRKFILRSGETVDELIGRTFLSALKSEGQTDDLNDPLYSALLETSKQHTWLTKENMTIWKEAFLSGKSSSELIEVIITNLDQKSGNDTVK